MQEKPVDPKELPLISTQEKRDALAKELSKRYSAWDEYIQGHYDRWETNENLLINNPTRPSDYFWKGYNYRHIPVTSSKARAWQSYVCQSPLQANPYFVGTKFGEDSTRANDVEQDFYMFMRKGQWERAFRLNVLNTGIYGKSIWRVRPDNVRGKPQFVFESVNPRTGFFYPTLEDGIENTLNCGHYYKERIAEIEECQVLGYYYSGGTLTPTSVDPNAQDTEFNDSEDLATEPKNKSVRVVESFDRRDYGHGEKWYRVRFVPELKMLLAVYDYGYSRPWYFEMFVHEEQGKKWPETSRFNDIQDLQHATNELWNLNNAGSQMQAVPTVFSSGWALDRKYSKPAPGSVVPIMPGGQVFPVNPQFNPGTTPILMEWLEKATDQMMRLGGQSQGAESGIDRTATAANIRKLATDVAVNDDLAQMDICMAQIATFMQELYLSYFPAFQAAYADSLAVKDPQILKEEILWELNGKSPANTPQAQSEAAIALAQMLANFNPQSIQILQAAGVNWQELMRTTVKNSILDNKNTILIQDQNAPNNQPGILGPVDGQPGMGMVPGPSSAGGSPEAPFPTIPGPQGPGY